MGQPDPIERARELLARAAHLLDEPGESNVVAISRFDGVLFDEAVAASPRLLESMWEMQRRTSYAGDLFRDLFAFFYLGSPQLHSRAEMKRSRWANTQVMRTVEGMPDSIELRLHTVHDAVACAQTLARIAPYVQWWLDQLPPEPLETVARLTFKLEGMVEGFESAADAASGTTAAMRELAELLGELEDAVEEVEDAAEAGEAGQGGRSGLMGALSDALDGARGEAQELNAGRSMFGMSSQQLSHLPLAEQVRLGELLNGLSLRKWLELMGQLLNAAGTPGVAAGHQRISGVRLSDDLEHMVGAELASAAHPVLRLEHLARLADGELLTYDFTGEQARGPVVICVDESSSMNDAGPADERGRVVPRKIWAKAFALAVTVRMRREGRPVRIVSFSSANQQQVWADDPASLMRFAESFQGGMTAFEPALDLAAREARDLGDTTSTLHSSPNVAAAIVLVTDDDRAAPSKRWLDSWAETSAEWDVYGVSVGVKVGQALAAMCSQTVAVRDFLDLQAFAKTVNQIA